MEAGCKPATCQQAMAHFRPCFTGHLVLGDPAFLPRVTQGGFGGCPQKTCLSCAPHLVTTGIEAASPQKSLSSILGMIPYFSGSFWSSTESILDIFRNGSRHHHGQPTNHSSGGSEETTLLGWWWCERHLELDDSRRNHEGSGQDRRSS